MSNFGRILVPVDFSPFSDAALALAIRLSDASQPIEVLHAWDPDKEPECAVVKLRMDAFLSRFADSPVALHPVIEPGDPYVRIVIAAGIGEFGLIVMGTHGQSKLVHLRMGLVAEQVCARSPCAVLTVDAPRGSSADEIPPWLPHDPNTTFETTLTMPSNGTVDQTLLGKIKVVCPNTQRSENALSCLDCADLKMACVSRGAGQLELICHRSPLAIHRDDEKPTVRSHS